MPIKKFQIDNVNAETKISVNLFNPRHLRSIITN